MNWYLAKMVFRIVCGEGEHTPQFDEQLRLVAAATKEEAFHKAQEMGQQEEDTFFNRKEQLVQWEFGNDGKSHRIFGGGHYDDVYERTKGGWRFKQRQFIPSQSGYELAVPTSPVPEMVKIDVGWGYLLNFYETDTAGAMILLAARAAWFHFRVLTDEARLAAVFGADYDAYRARVKRWIPYVL